MPMTVEKLRVKNRLLVKALEACRDTFALLAEADHPDYLAIYGDPLAIPSFVQAMAEELKKERNHWKSNHSNMVKLNAFLRDRPDLPADRLGAYERAKKEAARECMEIAGTWRTSPDTASDIANEIRDRFGL